MGHIFLAILETFDWMLDIVILQCPSKDNYNRSEFSSFLSAYAGYWQGHDQENEDNPQKWKKHLRIIPGTTDTCNNMDGCQNNYPEWKTADDPLNERILYDSIYIKF